MAKKMRIRGYAALFNSWSHNLGGFIEQIAPGAFDEALKKKPDVVCNIQHTGGLTTVARTSNGSLRLWVDDKGLAYEADLVDTNAGRDLYEQCRTGCIHESSFCFRITKSDEQWDFSCKPAKRTITGIYELLDVAPVDHPAYPKTSVWAVSE